LIIPIFENSPILLFTNEFIPDLKFMILLINCIYFTYNRTVVIFSNELVH